MERIEILFLIMNWLNLIYAIILLCNFSIKEERKNFSRIVSTLVWR